MKCNKLLNEAIGYIVKSGKGIDINSKSRTALKKLNASGAVKNKDDKISLPTLKNYLIKQGVSKHEIALTFGNRLEKEYTPVDLIKKLEIAGLDRDTINSFNIPKSKNDKLSIREALRLDAKNKIHIADMDSKEYSRIIRKFDNPRAYKIRQFSAKKVKSPNTQHFNEDTLGWSRLHLDTIDNADVLVLNEFQSDWAQGANKGTFPIPYTKFKKLAIVDALNGALTNQIGKVIIPIDRSKGLVGTDAITKVYSEVANKILPSIKKELSKSGLDIETKIVRSKDTIKTKDINEYIMNNNITDFVPPKDKIIVDSRQTPSKNLVNNNDYYIVKLDNGKYFATLKDSDYRPGGSFDYSNSVKNMLESRRPMKEDYVEINVPILYSKLKTKNPTEEELDAFAETYEDILLNNVKRISDLPDDTKLYDDIFFTNNIDRPNIPGRDATVKDLKNLGLYDKLKDTKVLNFYGDLYESTHQIEMSLENFIDDLPELYKILDKNGAKAVDSKFRWDMLSVIGALGLTNEYEKIKDN